MKNFLIVFVTIIVFSACGKKEDPKPTTQWQQLKSFPVNANASWIVPMNDTLVVSSLGNMYDMTRKIFISSDFGNTWVVNNKDLDFGGASPLIADRNTLYAGSWGKGVFRSNDLGKSWVNMSSGLPSSFAVMDLVQYSNRLFVCGEGIYYSDDNAETWHDISYPGTSQSASIIQIDTTIISSFVVPNKMTYLHKTSTNSINWTPVDSTSANLKSLRVSGFFSYKDKIYAPSETFGPIYVSSDKGKTWVEGKGFNRTGYNFAGYDNVVFVAGGDGVYKSVDFGKSWTNIGCDNAVTVTVLLNTLYAGTSYHGLWKLAL